MVSVILNQIQKILQAVLVHVRLKINGAKYYEGKCSSSSSGENEQLGGIILLSY